MINSINQIKQTLIASCKQKFCEYYAPLRGRNIYVYGSGMYGRFLKKALVDYGCVDKVFAFINDFDNGYEVDGIPVMSLEDVLSKDQHCFVAVGIQECKSVNKRLSEKGVPYFSAPIEIFFASIMLLYYDYSCERMQPISDALKKIEIFHSNLIDKESDIVSFYNDDGSRKLINNRLMFYKTGNVDYLFMGPVNKPEYFDDSYMSINENETYVDCGAYDGDSVIEFLNFVKGKYKKIIAFEPDKSNFKKLQNVVTGLHDIDVYPFATGNENAQISFAEEGGLNSQISETGANKVQMIRLDDLIKDEISLVKLDVEGAEMDPLRGCEKLIKKYRPKLAVSLYHRIDDLINIPTYLKKIVPEYKFKLRQHSGALYDTVLYAEI